MKKEEGELGDEAAKTKVQLVIQSRLHFNCDMTKKVVKFGNPVGKNSEKNLHEVSSGEKLCNEIQNFKFRKKVEDNLKDSEKKRVKDRGGKEMTRRGENWLRNITRKSQTEEKFKSLCSTNLKLRKNVATTCENSLGISPQRGKFKKQRKITNLIAKFEGNLKSSGNSSQSIESGLLEGTFQPKPATVNPKIRPKRTSSQSGRTLQTGPRQAHRTIQMLSHNWLQNPPGEEDQPIGGDDTKIG